VESTSLNGRIGPAFSERFGMNLLAANICQLQGSFSATTTEVSELSVAERAPCIPACRSSFSKSARGTQLMGVVPEDFWVVANFQETQFKGKEFGQTV
jgi:hypothetical protein